MKFKFNIAKTGLPDGEIIVGDWYEGENANLVPILTCNPLMTRVRLLQNSLYRSHKIMCFQEDIQLDICLWLYLEWYL